MTRDKSAVTLKLHRENSIGEFKSYVQIIIALIFTFLHSHQNNHSSVALALMCIDQDPTIVVHQMLHTAQDGRTVEYFPPGGPGPAVGKSKYCKQGNLLANEVGSSCAPHSDGKYFIPPHVPKLPVAQRFCSSLKSTSGAGVEETSTISEGRCCRR